MEQARGSSIAVRGVVVAASLAAIFGALIWTGGAQAIWRWTLVAVAVFYALVHAVPAAIFRLQSMPYTYQLPNNWGPRGFELQNVTYQAYHTRWYNDATHAAFPIEAWLWLLAAAHFGGGPALAALAAALIAQAFSFGERRFAFLLAAFWLAAAGSSALAARALGAQAAELAALGLVGFGFWRFTGHWVEPLPPGIVGNRRFVALRDAPIDARLIGPFALGYLSEFSAGLPFRLVNSWLFALAQRLGYAPERALPLAEARALARRIHAEGWGAQATTARVVRAARDLPPEPELEPEPPPARAPFARSAPPAPPPHDAGIHLLACDRGASVWLVAIGGRTVLFDAWLDDPYVSGSRAFFAGRRVEPPWIGAGALPPLDAIVLSSAEQDHAHPRTLARLDKRVPVFAGAAAARVASDAGYANVRVLRPGVPEALFGGVASALALPGYGRNLAVVLRDEKSGERVCIAHHGIRARWLARNAASVFRWQFARDAAGRLVDTLCLGVHTTLLRPPGVLARVPGLGATIVPDPEESAGAVALLAPRRVLFSHCTPEREEGFSVRHLLHYPTAADDVGHATRTLRARCPGVAIEGLPAPACWV